MLNSIPIDIVEIIIVKSFDYEVFQKLQEFLIKLKEPSRISRINDKLTVVTYVINNFHYKINNIYHREYDKPDYTNHNRYTWSLYNSETRINNPSTCWIDGGRKWIKRMIDPSSLWEYNLTKLYQLNTEIDITHRDDCPYLIDFNGDQRWLDENRQPYDIGFDGYRGGDFDIFHYL